MKLKTAKKTVETVKKYSFGFQAKAHFWFFSVLTTALLNSSITID
jgi:hypothetical protein